MQNPTSHPVPSIRCARRGRESGMALIMVLLLLLLVSAIGLGMVYMSNTETAINGNYRDSQLAFFAMRAGLEEARDRMRTNSPWPITLPVNMPGSPNSIVYITNRAGTGDTVVDPRSSTNLYFDDEFCHETFVGDGVANSGVGVPCTAGPPSSSVVWPATTSISPNTNTASALKYKWARLTLKQNGTFANYVDSSQPAQTQVCYQSLSNNEIPLTSVPGYPYTDCTAAYNAGQDASPVYVATSLAVTPNGSRRIGQYELAALNIAAPPVALGMDGPGANFIPAASSNNFGASGIDSGPSGYTSSGGTGSCTTTAPTVPAITTGDQPGVTNISSEIPTNRYSNYTGSGGSPSVVNGGASTFSGNWSSPADLDSMIAAIASVADVTYPQGSTTCSVNGSSPCTPVGGVAGTPSNPQITYVNGDFNLGSGSGAGVLVVTGTFSFGGNASWDGLVLVIGQGILMGGGGGNGQFNGSVFLAKTRSSTSPYPELSILGTPTIGWNGGGSNFIQYNSCWAQVGNGKRYTVVATREEMY